ncbi:hypothetical protein PA598K_02943 [Paenibacillus sp. 598K]|uniref:hypothetical protein n=1 Tax=Paenibacillus sp. 598K TaxID=1117987 RepID=UPI000FF94AEF|nr:hypothetical protein [Paenibacillus sp. 598K]GBF74586.1 hypothetical protein PA598K_02943 [Paenibacillus sp. 598K]
MDNFVIGIIVLLLVGVLYYSFAKRQQSEGKRDVFPAHKPPTGLGVRPEHPAYAAAQRLEDAIPADYEQRVKERMQQRYPELSDREWAWRWHEMKRFLLMAGLLNRVEMYSAKVDEVWHEMLMFTREYQTMCERFCGRTIHHAPHAAATSGADLQPASERAWFDWVYSELFGPNQPGAQLWGAMYRTPMSPELLELLRQPDEAAARRQLFQIGDTSASDALTNAREGLLQQARAQLTTAEELAARGERRYDGVTGDAANWSLLGGTLMLASIAMPDRMEEAMREAGLEQQRHSFTGSSCGSAVGGGDSRDNRDGADDHGGHAGRHGGDSHSHHDSSGDHGGGDSGSSGDSGGGSSCSSCSSCSS